MRIGEVAHDAGVTVQTVRLYERLGLLKKPPRLPSGYRDYPPDTARFIRSIKRAQELGFTLSEIKSLIELRRGARDAKEMRAMAEAKIRDLGEKIRQLQAIREALIRGTEGCKCANGHHKCLIIEAFAEGD